jgi:hypothetical protein
LVTNGDFQTGDFTGWTLYTNPDGQIGSDAYAGDLSNSASPRPPKPATPSVQLFDVTGSGASLAATFDAGKDTSSPTSPGGGGIYQTINTAAGTLDVNLDIAVWVPLFSNGDVGTFSVLVDGTVVDSHAFGGVDTGFPDSTSGAILRSALSGSIALAAGSHDLRISIERPYGNSIDTPLQYVDNISANLTPAPVPTPAAGWMMGSALLALVAIRRRTA